MQVAFERARVWLPARCFELPPLGADEVMDQYLAGGLAVTIDAAVALLEAVGVPRNLRVDEAMAALLQGDALRGGIGGQQDPDRIQGRICLPARLDRLAVLFAGRAVQQ